MTEQELIKKIQSLKQIKPKENWVVFTKRNILSNNFSIQPFAKANFTETFKDIIIRAVFSKNFAYSVAVFLLIMTAGAFIAFKAILPQDSDSNSTAALVAVKDNVEEFKTKSKVLSDLASNNSEDVQLAIKEVKEAAKELTDAIQKDPQLAKEVALDINNNKTYLNISGGENDLQVTMDALYKTTAEKLLEDLDNATLPEDKQKSLDRIKESLNKGEYEGRSSSLLEDVLLLSIAIESN